MAVNGRGHDGASGGSGSGGGLGFIEDGLRGGYGGRLDLCDRIGNDAELEHSLAGIPRVVGLAEDAVDAGDEGRSGVLVVLPAVGRWEGPFFMLAATCLRVVARAVKHTSAMVVLVLVLEKSR